MNSSSQSAFIEIRAFPWRLRTRVMEADNLREVSAQISAGGNDLESFLFGLTFMLFVVIVAPVLVLVLAGLLFAFELPVLIVLAFVLVLARLFGVIPWTIGIIDRQSGAEEQERTRSLIRAVRRVREVNGERRVPVRWRWS